MSALSASSRKYARSLAALCGMSCGKARMGLGARATLRLDSRSPATRVFRGASQGMQDVTICSSGRCRVARFAERLKRYISHGTSIGRFTPFLSNQQFPSLLSTMSSNQATIDNLGPALNVVTWFLVTTAVLAVVARVATKLILSKLNWDDYITFVALVRRSPEYAISRLMDF